MSGAAGTVAPERAPEAAPPAGVDVTLVVPVLTGEAAVREVVDALGGELERLGRTYEVIPVFDGVRGAAWQEAQELATARPEVVRPIAFQQRFGESACLQSALDHARGAVIVTTPHYVQIDPHEIATLLAAIDAGADFAVPWRAQRVDPFLNRLQSAGFNLLMRRIVGAPFHDLNCYFRAMRREVLEGLAIYGDMYRFLPVIAHRQGYRVDEVQVRHIREWGGAGFFGVGVYVRRLLDVLGVVFLTHFTLKPLRFFGILGAFFVLVGGFLSTAIVAQDLFVDSGIWNRPLFQLGVMLFILGVQVIGFGLVGEIIIYTQARNLREYRIERVYEQRPEREDAGAPDEPAA